MDAPIRVRLKRRADEPPPDRLIVEQRGSKRVFTGEGRTEGLYVRDASAEVAQDQHAPYDDSHRQRHSLAATTQQGSFDHAHQHVQPLHQESSKSAPNVRTFHLKRPAPQSPGARKRRARDDDIATFVEHALPPSPADGHAGAATTEVIQADAKPQKRPGRGAAVKRHPPSSTTINAVDKAPVVRIDPATADALANRLHEAALEELANEPKPKITSLPKLPPQRSREIHQARMAARTAESVKSKPQHLSGEMDLDLESEAYVYDTYVLAPTQGDVTALKEGSLINIGYLVITSEDQELWETYILESRAEEGDYNSDEDDENAEDYYGADYPEDELASDDEFDRGAYGYRADAGSDNEQWEADEPTWSDEDDVRARNPFAKHVGGSMAKYLNGPHDVVEDDVSSE